MNNLNQELPICFTTYPVSETELRDETDDLDLQRFSVSIIQIVTLILKVVQ